MIIIYWKYNILFILYTHPRCGVDATFYLRIMPVSCQFLFHLHSLNTVIVTFASFLKMKILLFIKCRKLAQIKNLICSSLLPAVKVVVAEVVILETVIQEYLQCIAPNVRSHLKCSAILSRFFRNARFRNF